jgi:glutamyl-tRNA(Gln) amidotransferase subunit B-like transamidase
MSAKPGPDWDHWPGPPVPMGLNPPRDDDWWPPWTDPWTGYWMFSFTPALNRFNPDTGKLYRVADIVKHLGLKVASGDETRSACEKVVAAHPDKVAAYRSGKANLIGFFIKLVMDETHKQASPKDASEILAQLLQAP